MPSCPPRVIPLSLGPPATLSHQRGSDSPTVPRAIPGLWMRREPGTKDISVHGCVKLPRKRPACLSVLALSPAHRPMIPICSPSTWGIEAKLDPRVIRNLGIIPAKNTPRRATNSRTSPHRKGPWKSETSTMAAKNSPAASRREAVPELTLRGASLETSFRHSCP